MFWFKWNWPSRILSVIGLFFVAAVLFPMLGRSRETPHGPSCHSQLKQIGLGFAQYVQDYDEKLPLVAIYGGWANSLQPYLKSTQLFQCPRDTMPQQTDPNLTGYTDYFYNAQIQGRSIEWVGDVRRIIMAAEGNDGSENTNARYSKPAIPALWRTDSASPAFRHLGGANYSFVDGHVKWFKVENISTRWSASKPYFQPKNYP